MTPLRELLARCETSAGPDREIERELFERFDMPTEWFGSKIISHFREYDNYGFNTEDGYRHLSCQTAPRYTSSIDAAIALVERLLPEWFWRVGSGPTGAWAVMSKTDMGDDHIGDCETPALALVAALLKSLIAGEEKGRG